MEHEECVSSVRIKIGALAQGMLNGTKNYLEGAIKLSELGHRTDVDNEDFLVFQGISSDIDHLPIGFVRRHWSKEALERHEFEIQEMTLWAKKISLEQCNSLVKKYGVEENYSP